MTMMMKTTGQEAMARRADGATQTQPKGGVAAVGGVKSAALSGEAASREESKGVVSSVAQRLHQMLARGKSLRIEGAPDRWRGRARPAAAILLATDLYTGDFAAWMTAQDNAEYDRLWEQAQSKSGAATCGKGVAA